MASRARLRKIAPAMAWLAISASTGLLVPRVARSGAVSAQLGYYSIGIAEQEPLASLSYLRAGYQHALFPKLEVAAGVSVFTSGLLSGDYGFGFDAGLLYYPLSLASRYEARTPAMSLSIEEPLRPFVAAYFIDRQFISAQQESSATYLGPCVGVGAEYSFRSPWDLRGEVRFMRLSGQSDISMSIMEILLGVAFRF